jgi:hypothetical protein
MQALRYAIARLAIDFVSGPSGIAGWLTHRPPRAPGDLRFARPRSRGYLLSAA